MKNLGIEKEKEFEDPVGPQGVIILQEKNFIALSLIYVSKGSRSGCFQSQSSGCDATDDAASIPAAPVSLHSLLQCDHQLPDACQTPLHAVSTHSS